MLWATAEADAWGRDFDYANYLRICDQRGIVNPVCEAAYAKLCEAFEIQFEKDVRDDEERSALQGGVPGPGITGFGVVPERQEA